MANLPIIEKMGGLDAAFARLAALGWGKSKDALRMALRRGRLPGEVTALLMKACDEDDVPYSHADFICTHHTLADTAA
jgi:hypothetical protein